MKTLYKFIALFCASSVFAGTEYDFSKGIDLSGKTSVTPYQLNALVDSASLRTNKGIVIRQATTPDTANNPRYTNFIWLDTSFQPPVIKVWATNAWISAVLSAGSVTTAALADNAVTSVKLGTNAVQTYHLNDNSVTESKIAAGQVTTSKFGNQSVTREKIYPASISSGELTNSAVQTTNIADLAVTSAKLANGSVGTAALAGNSIYPTNLATTLGGSSISGSAITATNIAGSTIQNTNLAATAVNTNVISNDVLQFLPIARSTWSSTNGSFTVHNNPGFSTPTRAGTGRYTFTFSSARSSTNYSVFVTLGPIGIGTPNANIAVIASKTTTAFEINTYRDISSTLFDMGGNVVVFPE